MTYIAIHAYNMASLHQTNYSSCDRQLAPRSHSVYWAAMLIVFLQDHLSWLVLRICAHTQFRKCE
jgi:hypothetical protein|eukprot:SAG25_NODE_2333_length_1712_cov_43.125897_1_plen_65_part_00